jgi:hypothetical protein
MTRMTMMMTSCCWLKATVVLCDGLKESDSVSVTWERLADELTRRPSSNGLDDEVILLFDVAALGSARERVRKKGAEKRVE